jgi:hypothetical protein
MTDLLQATNVLHVGNVLYLIAYLVRDILWLRVITILGLLCLMAFYYAQGPLYGPMAWNALFMLVNAVQIVLLVMERRPVFLGEEELQLYRTIFHPLKPREFAKLLSIAQWKRAKQGEELLQQNMPVGALMLLTSGHGNVEIDGRRVAEVASGQFVGEMGFLTEQLASARVVAGSAVDYLAWPAEKLRAFLVAAPELHVKVQGILGCDVVAKLRQEGFATAHPSQVFTALGDVGAV